MMGVSMYLERVAPDARNEPLISLAQSAREWTLGYAELFNSREIDPTDLCGGCAIAAGRLFFLMKKSGFTNMYIAVNNMHAFVVWHDGAREIIIDSTAGQIRGCDPIEFFVRDAIPRDRYDMDWWRIHKRLTSVAELNEYQKRRDWPKGQICPKRFRKIKKVD